MINWTLSYIGRQSISPSHLPEERICEFTCSEAPNDPFVLVESKMLFLLAVEHAQWSQKQTMKLKENKNKSYLFHTHSGIVEHVDPIINNKFANNPFVLVAFSLGC